MCSVDGYLDFLDVSFYQVHSQTQNSKIQLPVVINHLYFAYWYYLIFSYLSYCIFSLNSLLVFILNCDLALIRIVNYFLKLKYFAYNIILIISFINFAYAFHFNISFSYISFTVTIHYSKTQFFVWMRSTLLLWSKISSRKTFLHTKIKHYITFSFISKRVVGTPKFFHSMLFVPILWHCN